MATDDPTPVAPVADPASSPEVATTITRAAAMANDLVDDMRPRLLAGAGLSTRHGKVDGTVVTDADLHADRAIVAAVAATFPAHAVVSEEGATTWDGAEWTWVVDPIDGTNNFAAGLPWWAVSIALLHRGEVVWGMVDAPPLDRRWEATRGQGTTCNGEPVAVLAPADVTEPATRHSPISVTPGTIRQVRRGTYFKARILGAVALDLAMVASGQLLGAFARVPKVWDVAAGSLLVTEAGGAYVELTQPGHLPLRPGIEQADRSVVTAAGPTREWVAATVARLWPPK